MNKSIKQDIIDIIKESDFIFEDHKKQLEKKIVNAFNQQQEPISEVFWIAINSISPNSYNPNKMATPEKRLLLRSMLDHGITQPLLVAPEKNQRYELIDGYHRWRVIKTNKELRNRLNHKVPVVILNTSDKNQIVAAIRHNRARGRHQIGEIGEVVKTLSNSGWSSRKIMDALGMEADEVLRLKQFKGLGELFKDEDYSPSWSWEE
ncbi:ParB N-terminal domain-containing protein [Aquimarina spongiae]|uniref:Chromosome segregation protein Spo0J, contains ParB-like nuclease domain n=1 Tax=Aquimarina spongiae TaxID=570521 RepID=A0A1M6CY51_9FLAO|nr:ParB N-terminal domain-containing protein [Aquimarina spongiae]SHI65648.1 Chromosome segregation protein Spo0J, contains ParB-like nuclease domain [Aquimarina spongiae]